MIGQRIRQIRIEEVLGSGGMGDVYLGHDEVLDRKVAVKKLRTDRRLGQQAKLRFVREARLLSKLGHPGICQVYDLIETEDADFLVLEFIRGQTLRLAAPGLDGPRQLTVAIGIARALAAAHREGVIHRDLKPDNIMVSAAGEVKILDFGIARSEYGNAEDRPATPLPAPLHGLDTVVAGTATVTFSDAAQATVTEVGAVIGTPSFMSPEQALGLPLTVASDLYSLGLVLHELFTGRRAYGDVDEKELWNRVFEGKPDPIMGLDPDLTLLIEELESPSPSARPGAELVAARLGWIVEKPARRKARRRRRNLVGIAFSVLVAGLALMAGLARDARRARAEAESRRQVAEGLIAFMLGDLRGKLEGVGRLEILDEVGDRALAYFGSLDPSQLSARETESRIEAVVQIGEVRRLQGQLDEALAAFREAEALASAASRRFPDDEGVALAGVHASGWLGQIFFDHGDAVGAETTWQAVVEAAQRQMPSSSDPQRWRSELAKAYHNLGTARDAAGKGAEALADLRRSLELQEQSARALPPKAEDFALRAATLAFLSRALERQALLAEALAARRLYLASLENAVAVAPLDRQRREDLATGEGFVAGLEIALGSPDEGEKRFRHGLRTIDELAADDRTNADLTRWQIAFRNSLAWLLIETGRSPEALNLLGEAERLVAGLLETDPQNFDWRGLQATVSLHRARVETEKRGLPFALRAVALFRALAQEGDDDALRGRLAAALLAQSRHLETQDPGSAAQLLEEAWGVLASCAQPLSDWQLLEVEIELAARRGRPDAARAGLEKLRAIGWSSPARGRLEALLVDGSAEATQAANVSSSRHGHS